MSEKKTIEISLSNLSDNSKLCECVEKYDKVILSSVYCEITMTRHRGGVILNLIVSSDIVCDNNSTDSERQKIADFISNLPSDELLDYCYEYSIAKWMLMRDEAIRTAKCFLLGRSQDPIAWEVKGGLISEIEYRYRWLTTELYNNWWELINNLEVNFKDYLSKLPNYSFKSPRELFEEIVRFEVNSEILVLLKDLFIFKQHEHKKLAILANKELNKVEMSTTKFKELSELKTKYYPSSIWLKHVMHLARRLEHIPSIKTLLNQINLTQIALNKLMIKIHCDPEWRHLVPLSHTWEKGEFSSGIKPNWKA